MKNCILPLIVLSTFLAYPSTTFDNFSISIRSNSYSQNLNDRKLSTEEVKERGLDILANQIMENLDEIDIRKMARSAIFETTYGFRWKMINLHNSKKIIIKVDKDFKLIDARTNDNAKIMTP